MNVSYKIEIIPLSEADGGGFAARVPALPGCMTTGDRLHDLMMDIHGAIEEWIAGAKEIGKKIPAPEVYRDEDDYSGKLLLRMPKSTHKRVTEAAEREGCSINSYINECIAFKEGYDYGKKSEKATMYLPMTMQKTEGQVIAETKMK